MTRFRRNRQSRFLSFLYALGFGVIAYFLLSNYSLSFGKKQTVLMSPLPSDTLPSRSKELVLGEQSTHLEEKIQTALAGTKGTYGIVVKHLTTSESYYSNEHTQFDAASLYKLWIMAVVYQQIQEGKLRGNDMLSQKVSVLNEKFHIDKKLAEKTDGEIKLSVNDALEKMITISDNYAALLLTEKIKLSTVATFLRNNGLAETKVGGNDDNPVTTPYDVALFFEKLYKGKLANSEITNEMINLLKRQRLNEKLPKYLPVEIATAHKTGELGRFTHDAGIVFSESGDYIVVVLAESDSRTDSDERIANVSKEIYSYFAEITN